VGVGQRSAPESPEVEPLSGYRILRPKLKQ
jgi:hypothetical protein